jgi:hypothetical protein
MDKRVPVFGGGGAAMTACVLVLREKLLRSTAYEGGGNRSHPVEEACNDSIERPAGRRSPLHCAAAAAVDLLLPPRGGEATNNLCGNQLPREEEEEEEEEARRARIDDSTKRGRLRLQTSINKALDLPTVATVVAGPRNADAIALLNIYSVRVCTCVRLSLSLSSVCVCAFGIVFRIHKKARRRRRRSR